MLLAAVTVLSGVVGKLYYDQVQRSQRTEEKLDDCEEDRERIWRALAKQNHMTVEEAKREAKKDEIP